MPGPSPSGSESDCWLLLVEFTLSQKAWWIGLCAELDLTPVQGHALRLLHADRPVAMSTLADSLVCDASNVTGIVDKLEARGLIVRQGAEGDRRIKMLTVTAKGRALQQQLTARIMEPPHTIKDLSFDARQRLAEVFHALLLERQGTNAPVAALSRKG